MKHGRITIIAYKTSMFICSYVFIYIYSYKCMLSNMDIKSHLLLYGVNFCFDYLIFSEVYFLLCKDFSDVMP